MIKKGVIDHYGYKNVVLHLQNASDVTTTFISLSRGILSESNSEQLIQSPGKIFRKNIEDYCKHVKSLNWTPTIITLKRLKLLKLL